MTNVYCNVMQTYNNNLNKIYFLTENNYIKYISVCSQKIYQHYLVFFFEDCCV